MARVTYTKEVSKDEVRRHLQFAIASNYLDAEMTTGEDDSVLAVCKNAVLTTEGRNVLRQDFFKV